MLGERLGEVLFYVGYVSDSVMLFRTNSGDA
jgi:hypothetical protein